MEGLEDRTLLAADFSILYDGLQSIVGKINAAQSNLFPSSIGSNLPLLAKSFAALGYDPSGEFAGALPAQGEFTNFDQTRQALDASDAINVVSSSIDDPANPMQVSYTIHVDISSMLSSISTWPRP